MMRLLTLLFLFAFSAQGNALEVSIKLWKDSVMGALYNSSTQKVVFNRPDKKKNYKIYLTDLSGKTERRLTWPEWSDDRQQWAEEWTPDGKYLLCFVEKKEYVKEKIHKRKPVDATPGYGAYCDLWIIRSDGSMAWKILDLPNTYTSAIIHCAISRDGKKFAWSERIKAPKFGDFNLMAGSYVMRVADLTTDSIPKLSNTITLQPGNTEALNELDAISPDDSSLAFYSSFESKNILATPVYLINIYTGKIKKLTDDSFAQSPTFTPDGKKIVYMTGSQCDIFPFEIQGADWWMMNPDGSEKLRLTYMNKKNHPHSVNHYRLAGCLSFIDNYSFLGGVMTKPLELEGMTVLVEIKP